MAETYGKLIDVEHAVQDASPGVPRIMWTLALNAAILGIGIALATPGPTLSALAEQMDVSLLEVASLFSFRAGGYVAGGLAGDTLLKAAPSMSFAFFGPMAIASAGALAMPSVTSLAVACGLFVFQGVSMGMLDTVGNVVIMNLWAGSKYQNAFVHAFHFFFGLGAALAPAAVGCLLEMGLRPMLAWTGVGLFLAPGTLGFLVLACFPQPQLADEPSGGSVNVVVVLTGLFLFVYVGIEVAFGAYIDSFATVWLGAPAVEAARLTSFYWGSLCAGRFVAAIVTPYVHHSRYLAAHLVLAVVSVAVLTAGTGDPSALDVGSSDWQLDVVMPTALFGFALAPLFPGALLVAAELLGVDELSGTAASVSVALAALGEMLLPLGVGGLFDVRPTYFCWAQLALCIISAVLFLANGGKHLLKKNALH